MDESTQLIASLQHKLTHLDAQVSQYRRNMAAEYERYAESVLSDASEAVSDTVKKAVEATKSDYKNLHPHFSDPAPALVPDNVSEHSTAVTSKGKVRDREDRSIFDPPYLPLLDSQACELQHPSTSRAIQASAVQGKETEMGTKVLAGTISRPLPREPLLQEAFAPKRRNTDDVSVLSDSSDGPVRRSAIRRSSSSSKHLSPRRVRFDVEGKVVSPTASPRVSSSALASNSKFKEKEKYNRGSLLYNDDDDNDDEDSPSSERIETIDSPPPPKRVSSSQALRALSKTPLDDPSQWTTVSAGPDGSASIPKTGDDSANSSSDSLCMMDTRSTTSRAPAMTAADTTSKDVDQPKKSHDDDLDSSEDELVFGKASRTRQKPTALSLLSPVKTNPRHTKPQSMANTSKGSLLGATSAPRAAERKTDKGREQEADDQLFADDEPDSKYQASSAEESESDPDDEPGSAMSPTTNLAPLHMSQYSSSPARAIPQASAMRLPSPPAKGVVGSYRGESIHIPVVSDEVHAQAAAMGAVTSFVGSMNGRSGLDESDMQSFRTSGGYGSFSSPMGRAGGGPRSLAERLMMEELSEGDEDQSALSASGVGTRQNLGSSNKPRAAAVQPTDVAGQSPELNADSPRGSATQSSAANHLPKRL